MHFFRLLVNEQGEMLSSDKIEMINYRDLLLEQMDIPQWILAKPNVLKGDAKICISPEIQLLVVCDENHSQTTYFQDILRSLNIDTKQSQWLTPEQAHRSDIKHSPWIWLIQAPRQTATFASKFVTMTVLENRSWQELSFPKNKRKLWQQLQIFLRPKENYD